MFYERNSHSFTRYMPIKASWHKDICQLNWSFTRCFHPSAAIVLAVFCTAQAFTAAALHPWSVLKMLSTSGQFLCIPYMPHPLKVLSQDPSAAFESPFQVKNSDWCYLASSSRAQTQSPDHTCCLLLLHCYYKEKNIYILLFNRYTWLYQSKQIKVSNN